MFRVFILCDLNFSEKPHSSVKYGFLRCIMAHGIMRQKILNESKALH